MHIYVCLFAQNHLQSLSYTAREAGVTSATAAPSGCLHSHRSQTAQGHCGTSKTEKHTHKKNVVIRYLTCQVDPWWLRLCNVIEIVHCAECYMTFEEMLLHEPKSSEITYPNFPQKSRSTSRSAIFVLLYDICSKRFSYAKFNRSVCFKTTSVVSHMILWTYSPDGTPIQYHYILPTMQYQYILHAT